MANPEERTDLKDDDEGQPGSQDVPELQGELVRHLAPGRCSVVSVPTVSGLAAVLQLTHVEHRQTAVHVASQTPERERRGHQTITQANLLVIFNTSNSFYSLLILMVVTLVYTRAVFECVNKAGDVVGGDGNDECVGDDCQHADAFKNPVPDT